MTFKYFSPTKWSIPQEIIQQVKNLDPISMQDNNDLNKNPLYKQVGLLFQLDDIQFPVTLTDPFTNKQATITQEIFDELKQRYDNFKNVLGMDWSPFRMNWVRGELQDQILSFLPNELKKLNPRVSRQSKAAVGNSTPVHRDYHRTATLFYLLDQTDDVTSWWEVTDPFTEYDFWLWGDVVRMQKAASVRIQAGQWYLFDVNKYHSVESAGKIANRNSLCVEFYDPIGASNIYEILKDLNLI
jgi:hypothetical protein